MIRPPAIRAAAPRLALTAGFVAALLAASLLAGACRTEPEEAVYRFTHFAMGTVVEYAVVAPSPGAARAAVRAAHAEMERVAALLGEDAEGSALRAFNRAEGRVALEDEVYAFLRRTRAYHDATGGAFDVTIKPVLDLYAFDAEAPRLPDDEALRQALAHVGMDRLAFEEAAEGDSLPAVRKPSGAAVAAGGVAKGYAVDRAVAVLRERGIGGALVSAGGDLYALGTNQGRPWAVGVRHPDDAAVLVDTVYVTDRAVATSGDYQRFFVMDGERVHHLLDPETGRPARRARSATVVAASAEAADALATALFVAGPEVGLALLEDLPSASGLIVAPGGAVRRSADWPAGRPSEHPAP